MYARQRQTLAELSRAYGRDVKTLRALFDAYEPVCGELIVPEHPVVAVLDATFFTRADGILVCRAERRNILWYEIQSESIAAYERLLGTLDAAGMRFAACTIDGRRGVRQLLERRYPGMPIQYCQFHQLMTITHKLTKKPKLPAGRELRSLALMLTRTDRRTFTVALDAWFHRWEPFLKEKSFSSERRRQWRYTHERLRSAYFSLRRNLPWLFTYQDHSALCIPNTTNSCDGSFSHWKNKVKLHRSIEKRRRKKMVDFLLEQPS